MKSRMFRSLVAVAAAAAVLCMLSFYRTTNAAPANAREPFANSVSQRDQMIRELREIKELLKAQNALIQAQNNQQQDATRR